MDDTTIKQLWQGEIIPREDGFHNTPEMREILRELDSTRTALNQTLNEIQREQLEKTEELRTDYVGLADEQIFLYAFKLGARMMLEMITDTP